MTKYFYSRDKYRFKFHYKLISTVQARSLAKVSKLNA